MLKIVHNAGFFSNCSIRLDHLIKYFNNNKKLPTILDCSKQFEWYKNNINEDIVFHYFEHYNNYDDIIYIKDIETDHDFQYYDYKTINYDDLSPFIKKYFSPSNEIKFIINCMEKKYNITNYDDIISVFYRGNDKCKETEICSHENMLLQVEEIINKYPNKKILVQSDEEEFIIKMINKYLDKIIYFKDEIRTIKHNKGTLVDLVYRNTNYEFSKYFLAIIIMMSKTNYIICNSSNCSIWIMYYRGNANNTLQFLNSNWY
jgi:hypothetical protein